MDWAKNYLFDFHIFFFRQFLLEVRIKCEICCDISTFCVCVCSLHEKKFLLVSDNLHSLVCKPKNRLQWTRRASKKKTYSTRRKKFFFSKNVAWKFIQIRVKLMPEEARSLTVQIIHNEWILHTCDIQWLFYWLYRICIDKFCVGFSIEYTWNSMNLFR